MATSASSSSLQSKMQDLKSRLQEENEARERDRLASLDIGAPSPPYQGRPRPLPTLGNFVGPGRPDGLPGRKIRPGNLPVNFSPQPRNQEANDIEAKLQEIMKLTGVLTMDGMRYHTDIKDLEHMGELGTGTCGHVVKMLHKHSGKVIAVKQMRRSGNREENKRIIMDLEVVLKSHDCPFIVQCLGCFITDCDVWICMELMATCMDKLLKRLNQPIPEDILGKLAVATVKALHYLKESHGVIHRDVKPSNILLDEKGIVKLCDFGISGRLVDSKAKTRTAGCAAYMAPERIDPPDPTRPDYDIRADVWSLGITLVELATGQFPYKDCKTDFEVLTKVLQDDPPCLPPNKDFSPEFCTFVRDCLTKNYKQRPKYKKLLEHNFIKKYESKNVDVAAWFRRVMQQFEDQVKSSPQRRFTPPPGSPLPPPRRRSSEHHHRSLSETFRGLSCSSSSSSPSSSPAPQASQSCSLPPCLPYNGTASLQHASPWPYQNGSEASLFSSASSMAIPRPVTPQLFSRFPPDGLRWRTTTSTPATHQRTNSLDSNSNEASPRRTYESYHHHHPHYHHHHFHYNQSPPPPPPYVKQMTTLQQQQQPPATQPPPAYYCRVVTPATGGDATMAGVMSAPSAVASDGYSGPIHRLHFGGGSPLPFRRTDQSLNRRGYADGSPLTFRRYVGPPPPQPPPRRFSESSSVPGSPLLQRCHPDYMRTRPQFTPEPQRRAFHHQHRSSDL